MARAGRSTSKPIINRETVRVAIPIETLWELLSNTQRINQTLGLPPAVFTPVEDGQAMAADAVYMGMKFKWIERPFEWVAQRFYRVQRDFEGPISKLLTEVSFTSVDTLYTEVTINVEVTPNNPIGYLMAQTVFGRNTIQQYCDLIVEWEQRYRHRQEMTFPNKETFQVNTETLEQLVVRLAHHPRLNVPVAVIDRLAEHLRTAHDDQVVRMRPLMFADRWNIPRDEMVRLFLYATKIGLLDLHWEVLCPNCRVSKASYNTLGELQEQAHCETCHITFDASFDQYVELRFSVNPAVRQATAYTYCVGGPFVTRHIVAQQRIPPHSSGTMTVSLSEGSYRARCGGRPERTDFVVSRDGDDIPLIFLITDEGIIGSDVPLRTDQEVDLIVDNNTGEEMLFILERAPWDAQGLSASRVTALQEFRDMFSSEVLGMDAGVEVRTLSILFTDLKGSTKLYLQEGDSRAYSQVREQFSVLVDAITRHRGAMVKTIGDAVMAVFYEAKDAVEAALTMQAGVQALNDRNSDRTPLLLKVGIHSGPCIVITANDILDYFGTTVNIASYAVTLGMGKDIILTPATIQQSGVAQLLTDLSQEIVTRPLKGLEADETFYRVIFTPRTEPEPL